MKLNFIAILQRGGYTLYNKNYKEHCIILDDLN